MDFKQAKLDNQDIVKEGTTGLYYVIKEWRRLSTSDDSRDIDGIHGRAVSPTFARYRTITFEGYIDRLGSPSEQADVEYLQELFMLQAELGKLTPRKLYIKDMYDQEWDLDVKIKEPLDIIEGDDEFIGSHWKWRVVLESTDSPLYKSTTENEVVGEEGTYGGFTLPFQGPIAWNTVESYLEATTTGNTATPARFEITAINDIDSPLKIINLTKGTFFALDIDAVAGDLIIIDSETNTATKNGDNILGQRVPGSIWPTVAGTTKFVVEDKDAGLISDDFDVKIIFRNALL